MSLLEKIKSLPKDQLKDAILSLPVDKAGELLYSWELWARPDQLEPEGAWSIWMPLAGRGWGKTRAGTEWVRHRVKSGDRRIACVAPTKGDVRRVMVEGESGILNVCHKNDKTYKGVPIGMPIWSPTNNTVTWANGAKAEFFSAEDPERLRGPQFHSAWCDELAAWRNMDEVWQMLRFCLRLGKNPKTLITTTPKPKKLIRELISLGESDPKNYIITRGSTYDNKDNIDISEMIKLEGTRIGQQELHAEILMEAEGALWSMEMLDQAQIFESELPGESLQAAIGLFSQIVVSVDPATTSNEESDMTGIIVAATDSKGLGYVLEDATFQGTPKQWAQKAVELAVKYQANYIVYERNQGGDMVRYTLQLAIEEEFGSPDAIALRGVHASRGKFARAEPVSTLYEQKRIKHLPNLTELESQMTSWEPLGKVGSPDRLDALVWAITKLMLGGVAKPVLNLSYSRSDQIVKEIS